MADVDAKAKELVERLRTIDHTSVEDCFLQSPMFEKAAALILSQAETIAALAAAIRLLDLEPLVEGWHKGGAYDRHPDELGVRLPTNCGTVYALVAALRASKEP